MNEMTHPYLHIKPGKINSLAKWLSDIFNPVVGGIFIIGVLMVRILPTVGQALLWLGITVAITAIPTLLYVLYLVRVGYLIDIHMPERDKRLKPIVVIVAWLVISLGILKLIHVPDAMLFMLTAVILQVVVLGIITPLWKISFHSATIMGVATITILLRSPLMWFVIVLVPLIGWARVRLKRHTVMQVIGGYAAGLIVATVALHVLRLYVPL